MQKKRRNVKENGYKSEMNRIFCDIKLRGWKREEVPCWTADIVVKSEPQGMARIVINWGEVMD